MEWGDRGDELPRHGDLGQNPGCRFDFRSFHPTFHFPRDTSGRHATPRDTLWLMLLNFPNGVLG
jgi:hypothetical protein